MTVSARSRPISPRARLVRAISGSEMPKYVYGYPPKRAFRRMDPPRSIAQAWQGAEGPLNLYVHVPFCGYRCSFCTLFLTTSHTPEMVQSYVNSLRRQIAVHGALLGHLEVVSLYVGGGTPTLLEPDQLESLFGALHEAFPRWRGDAEIGVEGSPDTMRPEWLARARRLGVNRVSMGLQSLDPREQARAGRRYEPRQVFEAVEAIDAAGFDNVNYDLIYGLEGQTRQTWFHSLETTVGFRPQTVTLYPVVVRPLTSLSKRVVLRQAQFMSNAAKYRLYDESVEALRSDGFEQNSFVRFSRRRGDGLRQEAEDFSGVPVLGFGAGARSSTSSFHYGSEFAVQRLESLDIIQAFIEHEHAPDSRVGIGFELSLDEQKRRFCILNLSLGGIDRALYQTRFGSEPEADFADELSALVAEGCCTADASGYRLGSKGFKYSNVIGDLFQSSLVSELEAGFVPR